MKRNLRWLLILSLLLGPLHVWAAVDPCKECKDDCRNDRNEDYNWCNQTFPNLADPARTACFASAGEGYKICLGQGCFNPVSGPCTPKKDPIKASGAPVFDPSNPNVPGSYEYVVSVDTAGTYYITTANIGATSPLANLSIRVNGLTILDDPNYGSKSDTSNAVTLQAGQNRIVVSSTGTGNVAVFIGEVPIIE